MDSLLVTEMLVLQKERRETSVVGGSRCGYRGFCTPVSTQSG